MSSMTLTATRMRRGVWEGEISNAEGGVPQIRVTHLDKPVGDIEVVEVASAGTWMLRVPIPLEAIADGVQAFVVTDVLDGETLGHFTLIAGEALGDDIRVEMELLRAELDMLKRAFRRHCVETG